MQHIELLNDEYMLQNASKSKKKKLNYNCQEPSMYKQVNNKILNYFDSGNIVKGDPYPFLHLYFLSNQNIKLLNPFPHEFEINKKIGQI